MKANSGCISNRVAGVAFALIVFLSGCATQRTDPFSDKVDSNTLKDHTPYLEYFSLHTQEGYAKSVSGRDANGLVVIQIDDRKVLWDAWGHYYQVHAEPGNHTIMFRCSKTESVPPPMGHNWKLFIDPYVDVSSSNMIVRLNMREGYFYKLKADVSGKSHLGFFDGNTRTFGPYSYEFEVTEHMAKSPSQSTVVTNLLHVVPEYKYKYPL